MSIARPFHVHIRDVNQFSVDAPRTFPVSATFFHYSFAAVTEAEALEGARIYCERRFKDDGRVRTELCDVEVRVCVDICEKCNGTGGYWGRDTHWRKCRTCRGEPFKFDPGFGFTVSRSS